MLQKARIKIVAHAIYTDQIFSYHTLSSSEGKQKFVVIAFFLCKLGHRPLFNGIYYETSSVKIGFNMINKRHTLPIVTPC